MHSTTCCALDFYSKTYNHDHDTNITNTRNIHNSTFQWCDNNLEIKNDSTKNLKESYWLCSDYHFSFRYFQIMVKAEIFHHNSQAAFGHGKCNGLNHSWILSST